MIEASGVGLVDQLRELVRERTIVASRLTAIDKDLAAIREVVHELERLAVVEPPAPVVVKPGSATGALVQRRGGRKPLRADTEFAAYIQQHPGCSAPKIASALKTSRSILKRKLSTLSKAGLIHCVGRTTSARWFHGPPPQPEENEDLETTWRGGEGLSSVTKGSSSISPAATSRAGH